jgi:hypothetical protein
MCTAKLGYSLLHTRTLYWSTLIQYSTDIKGETRKKSLSQNMHHMEMGKVLKYK